MSELIVDAYSRTRARIVTLVMAPASDLQRKVPACPAWTAKDLLSHVVGMPAAIAAGRLPGASLDDWLAGLVAERTTQPVPDLLAEWTALDAALPGLLGGGAALLFVDLAVHEHDLRAALEVPDHAALEVAEMLPRTLDGLAALLREAGLGAIGVVTPDGSWRSHDAAVGWSLRVDAWEAVRALSSRRTADEVLALPAEGDAAPYLPVLDAHQPLPVRPLGER